MNADDQMAVTQAHRDMMNARNAHDEAIAIVLKGGGVENMDELRVRYERLSSIFNETIRPFTYVNGKQQ